MILPGASEDSTRPAKTREIYSPGIGVTPCQDYTSRGLVIVAPSVVDVRIIQAPAGKGAPKCGAVDLVPPAWGAII